jgi:hypothetical protein
VAETVSSQTLFASGTVTDFSTAGLGRDGGLQGGPRPLGLPLAGKPQADSRAKVIEREAYPLDAASISWGSRSDSTHPWAKGDRNLLPHSPQRRLAACGQAQAVGLRLRRV